MGKSVLIPIPLVKQIIDLLGYWDIAKYDRVIRDDYGDVMHALNVKLQKLELRDAYSGIVNAESEDSRNDARIKYLWKRARLYDSTADDYTF